MRTTAITPSRHRLIRESDVLVAFGCLVIALAVFLAVPAIESASGEAVSSPSPESPGWWAVIAAVVAQAVGLAGARRYPRTATLVVTALPLPLAAVFPGSAFGATTVAVLAAVYLAGVRIGRRSLLPVASAMFVLILLSTAIDLAGSLPASPLPLLAGAGQAAVVVGIPLLIALVVTGRRETAEAHQREVAALERERQALLREQDARVASAIAAERTAVARDLHDIAAHHMSGIAMLAAAVEREIAAAPDAARDSARDIRVQSMAVLGDLRRLAGLLREGETAPMADRSLTSVRRLVEDRRAAAAEVSLTVRPADGEVGEGVGALAQLVGYRMVQEALANAAVHAPGSACTVVIDATARDRLRIEVRNSAPARPAREDSGRSGFGLIGMRERAELVGAELEHGPTPDGGWSVTLDLPREAPGRDDGGETDEAEEA